MIFEGPCGRCGQINMFHTLDNTKCKSVVGNKICQGFPSRIFEVHTSLSSLQSAMINRLVEPKKGWPILKFRPIEDFETLNDRVMVDNSDLLTTQDDFLILDRDRYPALAKALNW